ncbi:MAG: ABC transporter ATP-binding protein [Acidobacteriota bacterium]|jgi:putative ABC transport system ATP-binding protein
MTAEAEGALIQTRGLIKDYPMGEITFRALNGVDLEIRRGEFAAIMGPSGSGKSTLMHILGCLDTPSEGEYLFSDTAVHKLSQETLAELRNTRIGFIFQSFFLLPRADLVENVELPLVYAKIPPAQRREKAMETLKFLGLETHARHRPNQLSGGQRQRVAIARALVNSPDLILADEPTGNLDSATSGHIMDLLKQLHDLGHTLILVTHDADIAAHASRLIRIRDGKIVSDEAQS